MATERPTTDKVRKARRPPPPSPIGRGEGRVPRKRIKVYVAPEQSPHTVKTAAKTTKTTTPPARIAQVGQIFVIENPKLDYNLATQLNKEILEEVDPSPSTRPNWHMCDWVQAYKEFRRSYGDDYDFAAMVPDLQLEPGSSNALPNSMPNFISHHVHVFNNVAGIHYDYGDYYDIRPRFGSTRLQGIAALTPDVVRLRMSRLHELGHRWGAYVLFKRSPSDPSDHQALINDLHHWSENFDSGLSSMSDTAGTNWIDRHDGTFSKVPYPIAADDQWFSYCPLDLYLMGMFAPGEVGNFFYIKNKKQLHSAPALYSGTRVDLGVENIVWAHGPRQPNAAHSQRTFRLACLVLTKNLDDGIKLAGTLQQYRIALTNEFREATRSRGLLDTYLYNSSYDGIYMKHHDLDTGEEPSHGIFWNSPDIWVRNAKDDGEDNQVIKPDQDNWVYVRVRNNGGEPSGAITVTLFQSDHSGTEFLYPQDWIWGDNHRIDESQPISSVPAGGEKTVCFKWDKSKVESATSKHLCLLAEILPSHPTQTKLRYVWEDRRIAQKNVITLNPPSESTEIPFRFWIGGYTLPERLVHVRIVQKKGGSNLDEVSLDIGGKKVVIEARAGRNISLPLSEGERKELTLQISWNKETPPKDVQFEITQLNEQYEVVGGLDLLIANRRSDHN